MTLRKYRSNRSRRKSRRSTGGTSRRKSRRSTGGTRRKSRISTGGPSRRKSCIITGKDRVSAQKLGTSSLNKYARNSPSCIGINLHEPNMNKCVYNYTMLNLIPTIKHNHSIVKYNTPKLKQQDLKNLITTSWNICGNNEYKNIYQINKISEVMWKIILAKAKILGMPNVNFISSWHAFAEFFENEHNRSVFRELIHLFNPINKNPTNGGSSSSDSDSPNSSPDSSPDSDYSSPDCSPISSPETNPNGSPNGYSGDNEGGDEGEDSRTEYLDQIDDIDDNRQFVTLHGAAKLKVKTFATLALIFIIIFAGSGTTFFFVESGLLDRLTNLFSLTNIAMAAMTTCAISASPWFIPRIVQFHQSAERTIRKYEFASET